MELLKNHAYILGSFWNPDAVKKLMGGDGQQYTTTDEEFERATQRVIQDRESQPKGKRRKRKRKIQG